MEKPTNMFWVKYDPATGVVPAIDQWALIRRKTTKAGVTQYYAAKRVVDRGYSQGWRWWPHICSERFIAEFAPIEQLKEQKTWQPM
jgi:hypothetical protein